MIHICRRPADAVGCRRPCNGKVFRGGLLFDAEVEVEKIPVGFDSEKSFAEMDKN
jgi:hypothetical protein